MGAELVTGKERMQKVSRLLGEYQTSIKRALPDHVKVERYVEQFALALRETPKLIECSQLSLFGSLMECVKLGLAPNTPMGHAWLIPFLNSRQDRNGNWSKVMECQLVIGYQGLIELTRRSGEILKIEARAVFDGDSFDWRYGTDPVINHQPMAEEDAKKMTHVYAVAWLRPGVTQFDVMTLSEVNRIRSMSKSAHKPGSPWNGHFVAMAKKTVLRRLTKSLPMSADLARAVELDEEAELLNRPQRFGSIDIPPARPGTTSLEALAEEAAAAYEGVLGADDGMSDADDADDHARNDQQQAEKTRQGNGAEKTAGKASKSSKRSQRAAQDATEANEQDDSEARTVYPLHPLVKSCGLIDEDERLTLSYLPTMEQPKALNSLLGVEE